MAPLPPSAPSSRTFLEVVRLSHRNPRQASVALRVNQGTKTRKLLLTPRTSILLRLRKRKKDPCRRFLVSLEIRRRKSPTNLLGTKETRHDQVLLGDSGKCLPSAFHASPGLCPAPPKKPPGPATQSQHTFIEPDAKIV